jgi:type I restriction enzyme, S subunit
VTESANEISPIDRKKITLGEIARNISENEYKPKEKGLDRCIGLEHLDPGSLKIRRWSPITPEMSFTRRFSKGHILFGKRRAYQKKVGVADFDGICSSDILVIEARKENFAPELLPFIIQDDRFFEYAVGTSSGSLSPRTKWKFLAEYEIWLPSLDEQRRIATTHWAAEDSIVKGERFIAAAERAKQVLMGELFQKGIGHSEFKDTKGFGKVPKRWDIVKLGEIVEKFLNGGTPTTNNTVYWNGDIPWTTSAPLNDFYLDHGEKNISKLGLENSASNLIPKGNIIVASRVGVGKVVLNRIGVAISQDLTGLMVDKSRVIPGYLVWYLLSPKINKQIIRSAQGTTILGVTRDKFERIPVVLPPLPEQRQIAAILTRCDETIAAARANVGAAKALKMKMINEMLSPPS